MSTLRETLVKQGLRLMSDPRVIKLMQDERLMKAVMTAISVPGKAQSFAREHLEGVVKAMALATETEVKDLRRTVRRLEDEVATMRAEHNIASKSGR
jgi:cell division FtsZ-interacting protein ZapD